MVYQSLIQQISFWFSGIVPNYALNYQKIMFLKK